MTKKIRVCKNFTYYSIIKEAILAQKGQKATSTQIFNYITNKHPHLFKQSNSMTWKGNIRQLLSKNPEFVKLQKDEISKLHYWRFVPIEEIIENEKEMNYEHNFMQFRNDHANYFNYYQSSHRCPMQNSVYNYYPEYPSYTSQFQEQFFGYKHHSSGFTNHMANRNNTDFYSMGKNCYVDNLFNNNNPQFNDPYLAYNYNTFMPSNRKDYECNKEDIKSKIMAANVLNELRDYQEDFHKNSRKTYRDFNEKPFNCSEAFADIQNNEFLSENKIFKNCEPDNNDPVKNKATVNGNIKNEYQDKSITTHSDQVYESFDKKCTLNNNNDENLQKYKIANLESYENFYNTNKSFKNKMSTEKTLNSNIEYHNKKNVIYDNFLQEKNNCEKDKIDVFIDLRNNTTSGKFKNNNTASLSLSDIVDNLDFANKESLSVIELPDVKVCSEKICSKSEDQAQILIRRRKCTSKPINSKQSTLDKNLSLSREESKSVALETKTQQNSSKHKTKGSEKVCKKFKK